MANLGLPRARDLTFAASTRYSYDTEMRMQLATVDHRARLRLTSRTLWLGASHIHIPPSFSVEQLVNTGYLEATSSVTSRLAIAIPFVEGARLRSWKMYLSEAGATPIDVILRKHQYGALSGGQDTVTDVGATKSTPGTTAGNVSLEESLLILESLTDAFQHYLHMELHITGDRFYALRLDYDPDYGLPT